VKAAREHTSLGRLVNPVKLPAAGWEWVGHNAIYGFVPHGEKSLSGKKERLLLLFWGRYFGACRRHGEKWTEFGEQTTKTQLHAPHSNLPVDCVSIQQN